MIIPSQYDELIAAGLDPVVIALQEQFNGENVEPGYSFRNYLGKRYSPDGSWQNLGVDNGLIAADIIALDSPLPVKERPSISQAKGEAFKIGTELPMNESDMKQMRLLARAASESELLQVQRMLFSDVRRVYGGVLEQIEYRFLQGLSQGFFVAQANGGTPQDNVGLGLRADFGYQASHLINASIVWGQPGYTAVGDLVDLVNTASSPGNGQRIVQILMDTATKNLLLASPDAANFVANFNGALNNGGRPTFTRLNEALQTEYGFVIVEVNRSIITQINGVKTTQTPWVAGQVIGLTQSQIGTLVWSDVEEMNNPVGGVNYSRAEDFILLSMYRTARPSLKQWTGSQAVAIPVINSDLVYKLDTTTPATT